jgi:hypothetical protein
VAILFQHGNGKITALRRFPGNLALSFYPIGNICQTAYILVRKPVPIRYALVPGAQRGGTAIKIFAIHNFILCPKQGPLPWSHGRFSKPMGVFCNLFKFFVDGQGIKNPARSGLSGHSAAGPGGSQG